MNWALWKKSTSEAKWMLLGCGLAVFSFCWIRVWIISRLDMSRFQIILEQLWDTWGKFSPVPLEQVLTYPGRLAWTFTEPVVVLGVAVFAIGRGSDVVSGELGRGTMEMLLAQPISRLQVLRTQAAVTVLGVAVICSLAWLGIVAGVYTNDVTQEVQQELVIPGTAWRIPLPFAEVEKRTIPLREKVDPSVYFSATLNLFALGLFLAGLTTFASACDRYRWRTLGIVAAIFVCSWILKVVSDATDGLQWLGYLSFFEAYQPEWSASVAVNAPEREWSVWFSGNSETHPGPLGYSLILVVLAAVSYAAAAVTFCRRDLPAPL